MTSTSCSDIARDILARAIAGDAPRELPPALLDDACGHALFGILAEGLADRFEPALCEVYADLFAQAIPGADPARYRRVRIPRPRDRRTSHRLRALARRSAPMSPSPACCSMPQSSDSRTRRSSSSDRPELPTLRRRSADLARRHHLPPRHSARAARSPSRSRSAARRTRRGGHRLRFPPHATRAAARLPGRSLPSLREPRLWRHHRRVAPRPHRRMGRKDILHSRRETLCRTRRPSGTPRRYRHKLGSRRESCETHRGSLRGKSPRATRRIRAAKSASTRAQAARKRPASSTPPSAPASARLFGKAASRASPPLSPPPTSTSVTTPPASTSPPPPESRSSVFSPAPAPVCSTAGVPKALSSSRQSRPRGSHRQRPRCVDSTAGGLRTCENRGYAELRRGSPRRS